jgi:S-adenosylmethionine uptake transporter
MQALWMVLGAFSFATMAVCVKIAAAWFSGAELVFYRGLLGMLFMWLLARGQGVSLATRYPAMHAWRSLVGVLSLGAWFYAIAKLPLATALTLNYMSSVWVAAFLLGGAALAASASRDAKTPGPAELSSGAAGRISLSASLPVLLGQSPLALSVLAGFAGVVMTLQPTIDQNQAMAGLVGLLSGFSAAFAYLQVMALGKIGEPDSRTVFYFAVGSAVAGAFGMAIWGVSAWNWIHALWLLPVGLLASIGQLCMTRAYNHGATLVVASLQYSGIVFGAIYGMWLFGDRISLSGWAGMALIVASGIAATALRTRAVPRAGEH